MKVYVASSFKNKRGARRAQVVLKAAGHTITFDWTLNRGSSSLEVLSKEARKDLDGVLKADALVMISPGRMGCSGEIGAALAKHIFVFILGMSYAEKIQNVYWNHPAIRHVANMNELLMYLDKIEGKDFA